MTDNWLTDVDAAAAHEAMRDAHPDDSDRPDPADLLPPQGPPPRFPLPKRADGTQMNHYQAVAVATPAPELPTEHAKRLYRHLVEHYGDVRTKKQALAGANIRTRRQLDIAARQVQRALDDAGHSLRLVNVWGVGYRMEARVQ